jgi:hypothetical protein
MKQMFTFLVLFIVSFSSKAGQFSGSWSGDIKYRISLEDLKLNARMDFQQNGNYMLGILYLTKKEKAKDISCEYLVYGWINNQRLEMRRMLILKNEGLQNIDASLFVRADASFDFSEKQNKIRASVFMKEENFLGPPGTLRLVQKDTALSATSKELLQKYTAIFFPSALQPAVTNTDFRSILWRKQLGDKPVFDFIPAKNNNPLLKVGLYFNGVQIDSWNANEENDMQVDVTKLQNGMYCFVLKLETPTNESVRFSVRRSAANVMKDILFDISYTRQVIVIMGLDE